MIGRRIVALAGVQDDQRSVQTAGELRLVVRMRVIDEGS